MEHFTIEGQWWLPERPGWRVPGTLTFDSEGLRLVLYDALRAFEVPEGEVVRVGAPEWKVEPVVHGLERDGDRVTLLDVGGANMVVPFEPVQEAYRAEVALKGCHTDGDSFSEAWFGFDYLDAWADPPSITVDGDMREAVEVQLGRRDLAQADVAGAHLRLVWGVEGKAGGERVNLARRTSFVVTPKPARTATSLIDGYARVLQDLLMVSLGRPVALTSVRLLPTDLEDPREGASAADFYAVQPTAGVRTTSASIEGYTAPTILSMHRPLIEPAVLLSRWFDLWSERREVLTQLLSPLYAPFMYGEHAFGSAFQSAEALHDLVLPTRDMAKTDHRERVKAVIEALRSAALPPETVEWASRVLASRNDKPLARKVDDLVRSTGAVGEMVLDADPTFGQRAASARAGVAHGGAEGGLNSEQRHWYAQALRWVVRTHLLMEVADDPAAVQKRAASRTPFRRAVSKLKSTID